ncbi:magnesium dechelatase SGRL, chloroplastic isoform X3 [Eucalyptus grandis]|uniref:magnesium dechelatase SGRL, chloroplastic isoform X3 n=1 Tax=Eucalyptus grandis TaxID=71139 RepID=UPI00192EEC09|nr:magnesium dechelatase SGRL, chloroplastic isoform X3 [Eucalyptus grandis]
MASHFAPSAFSPTPNAGVSQLRSPRRPPPPPAVLCVQCYRGSPYNTLVSEAVRLLVPPARFEASKLKVDFTGGESDNYSGIIPRTYILSHCDFTANLNLTISNVISLDQVLKAVLHGDALLFTDHPELMDAPVWVYFHSSSQKYNRIECWGPFKDAAQREQIQGFSTGSNDDSPVPRKWRGPKSIFQALFAFLL